MRTVSTDMEIVRVLQLECIGYSVAEHKHKSDSRWVHWLPKLVAAKKRNTLLQNR